MDAAAFEQVYGAFGDFHAYFAPLFGRREARDHSRHYLQALLVQSGERRNAENLSETVPASARVMQRFLAESPWNDGKMQGRQTHPKAPPTAAPCKTTNEITSRLVQSIPRVTLKECVAARLYVSVFSEFRGFKGHVDKIAWETEVWIAESRDYLTHFNGDAPALGLVHELAGDQVGVSLSVVSEPRSCAATDRFTSYRSLDTLA